MNKQLSIESLVVETFSTETVASAAAEFIGRPSRNYTDCGSCGIACTYVEC